MNINLESAKDTLCKNILIYGYCKFENKGCAFSHNRSKAGANPNAGAGAGTNASASATTSPAPNPTNSGKSDHKKKFNFNTPSFQPSSPAGTPLAQHPGINSITSKFSNLSPKLNDIPSFVPSNGPAEDTNGSRKFNTSASVFMPSFDQLPVISHANPYANANSAGNQLISSMGTGEMFFQGSNNYPLNYHLYAPAPPPHLKIPLPEHQTSASDMFIPNELRETLLKRNEATLMTLGANSGLPDSVGPYHLLMPLDMDTRSRCLNVNSSVYKVFSNVDGNAYAMRKIQHEEAVKIENKLPFKNVDKWKLLSCSNVVNLHDCFTTIAFGGRSQLCLIDDYYPNASTLLEHHINRKLGSKLESISEEVLWVYIIQITNALTTIHKHRLAARSSLDLSKILVVSKNRIKLSSCGVSDILEYEQDEDIKDLQKQDLKRFGQVILELASLLIPADLRQRPESDVLKSLLSVVSEELVDALTKLNIDYKVVNLEKFNEYYLSKRLLKMINDLQDSHDYIENQLTSELENARLFRLLSKINFIIDNPRFNWNENEKVYLIKLFRDHIFHQADEQNKPIIDLSRVLVKLNKLDCGIDQKFMLITRDEKLSILVSYKELRDIIDSTFRELTK